MTFPASATTSPAPNRRARRAMSVHQRREDKAARKAAGRARAARYWRVRFDAVPRHLRPVKMGRTEHRKAVAEAMEAEARAMPHGKRRKALLRKAEFVPRCGDFTRVRQCVACGEARAGSGTPVGAIKCDARACEVCARERAQKARRNLAAILPQVPRWQGYGWKLITITQEWDKSDPASYTVAAMRARAEGMRRGFAHVWKEGLRQPCSAAFRSIEMDEFGFIHAHVLYYGPVINKGWAEDKLREAYPAGGFWFIDDLDAVDEGGELTEEGRRAVLECAKYASKGRSPKDERWMLGDVARWTMNPVIAARWEAAVGGMHLTQKYGTLRGLSDDEEADLDEGEAPVEEDGDVACACCGTIGEWIDGYRKTKPWVLHNHGRGSPAFHGSKFKAREEDEPLGEAPPMPDAVPLPPAFDPGAFEAKPRRVFSQWRPTDVSRETPAS